MVKFTTRVAARMQVVAITIAQREASTAVAAQRWVTAAVVRIHLAADRIRQA